MEKNKAGLVLAIIAAIFGIIGGLMWTACSAAADSLMDLLKGVNIPVDEFQTKTKILLALSIIFGIGGSVVTLVGGIQGNTFKKGSFICAAVGCACQLGLVIAIFAILGEYLGGLAIVLCLDTVVALILAAVQTLVTGLKILNRRKAAPAAAAPAAPAPVEAAPIEAAPAPVAEEIAATEEEKPTTTEEE